jgi:hypothetical protein
LSHLFNSQPTNGLRTVFEEIKKKPFYEVCYRKLIVKQLRQAIFFEINASYVFEYFNFILEQTVATSSKTKKVVECKANHNDVCIDLYDFFFKRSFFNRQLLEWINSGPIETILNFIQYTIDINSFDDTDDIVATLKTVKYVNNSKTNSHILVQLKTTNTYLYVNEKVFNLLVYLLVKVKASTYNDTLDRLFPLENDRIEYVNCSGLHATLTSKMRDELFLTSYNQHNIHVFEYFLNETDVSTIVDVLTRLCGIPLVNLHMINQALSQKIKNPTDLNALINQKTLNILKLINDLSPNKTTINLPSQDRKQVKIFGDYNSDKNMDCDTQIRQQKLSTDFFARIQNYSNIKRKQDKQTIAVPCDLKNLSSVSENNLKAFLTSLPVNKSISVLIEILNNHALFNQHRYIYEMLVDLYVRLNKKFNYDFYDNLNLIFRNDSAYDLNTSGMQSYLLSIALFKFNMSQLDSCLNYLFDDGCMYRARATNVNMILDFLWAVLYKPEFWRCMDHKEIMNPNGHSKALFTLDKTKLFTVTFFILVEFERLTAKPDKNNLMSLFKRRMLLVEHLLKPDVNFCKINFIVERLQEIRCDGST